MHVLGIEKAFCIVQLCYFTALANNTGSAESGGCAGAHPNPVPGALALLVRQGPAMPYARARFPCPIPVFSSY